MARKTIKTRIAAATATRTGPLYDPDADRTFAETLKKHLNSDVPVIEVDLHLNTPEFGKEAVELFHQIFSRKN